MWKEIYNKPEEVYFADFTFSSSCTFFWKQNTELEGEKNSQNFRRTTVSKLETMLWESVNLNWISKGTN